eukprot:3684521-Lingulodinium_polyedra.AAC.1
MLTGAAFPSGAIAVQAADAVEIDGVRKAMFSLLLRAGAVLGSGVRLPSAKDTCTGTAARE